MSNVLADLLAKVGFEIDTSALEGLGTHIKGIHHLLEAVFVIEATKMFVELGHKVFELAESFAALGEQLESASISAGLTTDELQELGYAASQNAVSQGELSGGLTKLNRLLYQAREGSKGANATFAKLGITPEQIAGFRNSAEALEAVQDEIAATEDPIKRQALTLSLFGRGSANFVKFLSAGSAETRRLKKESVELGAVLSHQYVENLAKFEDASSGLKLVTRTFFASIGAAFAPLFMNGIKQLEVYWSRNQQRIQDGIKAFVLKAAYYYGYVTELFRLLGEAVYHIVVERIYEPASKAFKQLAQSIKDLYASFDDNKTAAQDTISLWNDVTGVATSLGGALGSIAQVIATIGWGWLQLIKYIDDVVPGGGWNQIRQGIVDIATIVEWVIDKGLRGIQKVLETVTSIIDVLFGTKSFWQTGLGQFAHWVDTTGQGAFDAIARFLGHDPRALDASSRVAVASDMVQGSNAVLNKAQQMAVPYDSSSSASMRLYRDASSAPVINVSAPVTVNVPPGTTPEAAKLMVQDAKQSALLDALNDAHRNLQHPAMT